MAAKKKVVEKLEPSHWRVYGAVGYVSEVEAPNERLAIKAALEQGQWVRNDDEDPPLMPGDEDYIYAVVERGELYTAELGDKLRRAVEKLAAEVFVKLTDEVEHHPDASERDALEWLIIMFERKRQQASWARVPKAKRRV